MKIIRSEFAHAYGTYAFGYTLHARLEDGDTLSDVYGQGFLPRSDDPEVFDLFYMARGVRIPLSDWEPSSENRRVLRKFDGRFTTDILSQEELSRDEDFKQCFLAYFRERHGEAVMSEERMEGYFKTTLPVRGIRYQENGVPAGYVLEVIEGDFLHYWFSCYTIKNIGSSLGMWLMVDSARRAKEEGLSHLYLGTAYGQKGRYKMNFCPLEFWDGSTWNPDQKTLARYTSEDDDHAITLSDRFTNP